MSRMKTTGLGESLVSHGQPHFIQCLEDICRGEGRAGGGWARIISMPKISSFKQLYDYAGGINFIFSDSHTLVWGGGGRMLVSRLACTLLLLLSCILIIYYLSLEK